MQFTTKQLYPYRQYFPRQLSDQNLPVLELCSHLTKLMIRTSTLQDKLFLSNLIICLKTQPNPIKELLIDIDKENQNVNKQQPATEQHKEQSTVEEGNKKQNVDLADTAVSFNHHPQVDIQVEQDGITTNQKCLVQFGINTQKGGFTINYQSQLSQLQELQQSVRTHSRQLDSFNQMKQGLQRDNSTLKGQNFNLVMRSEKLQKKCQVLEQIIKQAKHQMIHFEKVMAKGVQYDYYFGLSYQKFTKN